MKVSELKMAPNAYYNSLVCNKQVNYISQPFPKVKPKPRRGFQMNDNVDKLYDLLARNHTKNREPPIISQEKGKKLIVPEFLSIILDFSEQITYNPGCRYKFFLTVGMKLTSWTMIGAKMFM